MTAIKPCPSLHRNTNTLEKLQRRLTISEAGCWILRGSPSHHGYMRVKVGRRTYQAHRYFYEQLIGPIPDGLELDHLCKVTGCVRPDHLEPVTGAENKRRQYNGKCAKGHVSAEDAYVRQNGRPRCRKCKLAAMQAPWTCPECGRTLRTGNRSKHRRLHAAERAA